jgi:hypothetical protein
MAPAGRLREDSDVGDEPDVRTVSDTGGTRAPGDGEAAEPEPTRPHKAPHRGWLVVRMKLRAHELVWWKYLQEESMMMMEKAS